MSGRHIIESNYNCQHNSAEVLQKDPVQVHVNLVLSSLLCINLKNLKHVHISIKRDNMY